MGGLATGHGDRRQVARQRPPARTCVRLLRRPLAPPGRSEHRKGGGEGVEQRDHAGEPRGAPDLGGPNQGPAQAIHVAVSATTHPATTMAGSAQGSTARTTWRTDPRPVTGGTEGGSMGSSMAGGLVWPGRPHPARCCRACRAGGARGCSWPGPGAAMQRPQSHPAAIVLCLARLPPDRSAAIRCPRRGAVASSPAAKSPIVVRDLAATGLRTHGPDGGTVAACPERAP